MPVQVGPPFHRDLKYGPLLSAVCNRLVVGFWGFPIGVHAKAPYESFCQMFLVNPKDMEPVMCNGALTGAPNMITKERMSEARSILMRNYHS